MKHAICKSVVRSIQIKDVLLLLLLSSSY